MSKRIIGVVGAGSMGSGIAQVAATYGHLVHLYDSNAEAVSRALAGIRKTFDQLVAKGKYTAEAADAIVARIVPSYQLGQFRDCGLIIEAIIEKLDIKQQLFRELEAIVSPNCILASNTSSLSIAAIAASCRHSDRVLGIHFFNPAPLMKLVEIIPAVQTADVYTQQARQQIEEWGKLVVLAKDTPGFIVNRVARPFYGEALRIFEEGIADRATIDWAMTEIGGFRMGPFTLMDYIGNDINYTVTETVFQSFFYDPRYKPSFTQKRLMEAGYLGRKTGRGHYDYSEGAVQPPPNKDRELGQRIFERILVMLINEAADALFWQIATASDIDLAMTTGVNYPKGLLQWAEEFGIARCVQQLDALYNEYREDRYRCSPLLRRKA